MIITLLLLFFVAKASTDTSNDPISKNNKPLIISLPANKYSFLSGSAVLPQNLKYDIIRNGKDGVILKLIEENIANLAKSDKQVDVIEVIGHTDGQALGLLKCDNERGGNLDKNLEYVAQGTKNVAILCPGSNADLGLMRALAVVKELQKAQKQKKSGRFKEMQFRAYSAAQLLLPDDEKFAPINRYPNQKRRRIEIRFAQLGEYITPDNNP
ncbi:flagellar motor protein [Anabaena sp. UHCC 0451]|uniref:flagellar motor protein n=1 Tax=Anabaena sp. UHCC 0451 TaxID=2055235 RepID=UPI002B1FFF73|nr:flagellar motor protein [Anabaena sp. UHCC 0451]MEA5577719.1 flagellar motor protein [Anabaena sp. UHCC 0451]